MWASPRWCIVKGSVSLFAKLMNEVGSGVITTTAAEGNDVDNIDEECDSGAEIHVVGVAVPIISALRRAKQGTHPRRCVNLCTSDFSCQEVPVNLFLIAVSTKIICRLFPLPVTTRCHFGSPTHHLNERKYIVTNQPAASPKLERPCINRCTPIVDNPSDLIQNSSTVICTFEAVCLPHRGSMPTHKIQAKHKYRLTPAAK